MAGIVLAALFVLLAMALIQTAANVYLHRYVYHYYYMHQTGACNGTPVVQVREKDEVYCHMTCIIEFLHLCQGFSLLCVQVHN